MAVNITIDGTVYSYPSGIDTEWGDDVTAHNPTDPSIFLWDQHTV